MDAFSRPCGCGSREWLRHGSYETAAGWRRRLRCVSCGATRAVHVQLDKKEPAKKRPATRSRAEFWTRVLRSFPFLTLSAALKRAEKLAPVSSGLRSRLVREVVRGEVELPEWKDERHLLLRDCLRVYAASREAPPPLRIAGLSRHLDEAESEACWRAIFRARGIAALVWTPRRRAFNSDDLATGRPEPMPYFLDAFAPGVDPWRELLPEGLNPWWFGRARRFAELVEAAVPELSGSYQGRDWLYRWGSEEQRLWQVHRAIHPALPPADADDLWATDPAPVAERGKVLLAMEGALYELCMRYEVDPVVVDTALERSLRYRLYLGRNAVTAEVCTRRRVVGVASFPGKFRWHEGLVEFTSVLGADEDYYGNRFAPPGSYFSLSRPLHPVHPPPRPH